MIRTKLCDLLNIQYPIIQGAMAWLATAELAVAVSEAGGLGIIASGNAPAQVIEREIKKAKAQTNKPFGVNIMLLSPHAEEIIQLVQRERIPVVTTGAGNPGKYIAGFKAIGTKVLPVVPTAALAKRMEDLGADGVIVEGTESGGHIGELTTMALVPQAVTAVSIPVIAAGGIADGRGLVAALALGAQGVQMGTRFICATECIVHDHFKQLVVQAKERDTVVTGRVTGHPVRVLKNRMANILLEREKQGAGKEEIEALGIGKLELAVVKGDVDNGSFMAGQVASMVKKIQPASEIIQEIMADAQYQLSLLSSYWKE